MNKECRAKTTARSFVHAVINGKHTDKFTFLLDINNVPSLHYAAIHLCIPYAFITQAIRHKNPSLM